MATGSRCVTLAQPGQPAIEDEHGVSVRRIDGGPPRCAASTSTPAYRFLPPAPDPGVARALQPILRELQPDVIHAHAWMLYSALPLSLARRHAIVMTLHDYGLACARKTYVRDDAPCSGPTLARCLRCAPKQYGRPVGTALVGALRLGRTLHDRVDRYLAVSTCVRDRMLPYAAGRPVDVVPNFLAADVAATEPDPGLPSCRPRTGTSCTRASSRGTRASTCCCARTRGSARRPRGSC